ncbi:MAG: porin [Candidatus Firestonebacteria bacterium]
MVKKKKMFFVAVICSVVCILNTGVSLASETDVLLNKLVEKGQLTSFESQEVRNEIDVVRQKEEQKKKEEESQKKEKDKLQMKISGYTQLIYVVDPTLGGKEPLTVKRSRISFSKMLNDWASFKIQPDFAGVASATGGGNVAFREAFIELIANSDCARFRFGQYHQPFGFENNFSSSKKKVADTPQYMSKILTTDYDYGIQWWGNLPGDKSVSWRIAVMNGSGSTTEDNTKKDVAGRLVIAVLNDIEFGASAYSRYAGATEKIAMHYGGYFKLETAGLLPCPLFITAEYVTGKDSAGAKDVTDIITTVEVKPFVNFGILTEIAPVVRHELFKDGSGQQLDYVTVGLNFYIDKSVRVLTDYVVKNEKEKSKDDNRFNIMLQVSY